MWNTIYTFQLSKIKDIGENHETILKPHDEKGHD